MLYRKINSCLLYNSQTNMLNKILRHLSSKGRVWVLCYFSPFTVLIFFNTLKPFSWLFI